MKKGIVRVLSICIATLLLSGCAIKPGANGGLINGIISPTEYVTLTLNSNNGTPSVNIEVEKNRPVSRPANPTKEGEIFYCWCYDAALTNEIKSWPILLSEDKTVYAKYRVPADYSLNDAALFLPSLAAKFKHTLSLIDDSLYFDQGKSEVYDFNETNFLNKTYTKAFLEGYKHSYDTIKILKTTEIQNAFLRVFQASPSLITYNNGSYSHIINNDSEERLIIGIENEYVYFEFNSIELMNQWESRYYSNNELVNFSPRVKIRINVLKPELISEIILDAYNYLSFTIYETGAHIKFDFFNDVVGIKEGIINFKCINERDVLICSRLFSYDKPLRIIVNVPVEDVLFFSAIFTNITNDTCIVVGNSSSPFTLVVMDHNTLVREIYI